MSTCVGKLAGTSGRSTVTTRQLNCSLKRFTQHCSRRWLDWISKSSRCSISSPAVGFRGPVFLTSRLTLWLVLLAQTFPFRNLSPPRTGARGHFPGCWSVDSSHCLWHLGRRAFNRAFNRATEIEDNHRFWSLIIKPFCVILAAECKAALICSQCSLVYWASCSDENCIESSDWDRSQPLPSGIKLCNRCDSLVGVTKKASTNQMMT